MLHGIVRHLVGYAVHREPGVPPTILQRLLIALFIVAARGILWFVYGIFAAIPIFLFEIELFGARVSETAFTVVALVLAVGIIKGSRDALDYWRNYER